MKLNGVIKLREAGLSYAEISRKLGISRERVRQIINRSKLIFTIGDVSQLLGVHHNTVRRWSEKGILKSYRVGPRRDRRFRLEDVEDFLNKGAQKVQIGGGK
jgi:excisionase family DNA binding protein